MCLQHPCYERLNRFAASKPARIGYGVLLVIVVAFTCFRLLQRSDKLHATRNAKLVVIPDGLIHFDAANSKSVEDVTSKIDQLYDSYSIENGDIVHCDNEYPPPGKSCDVDLRDLRPCSKENMYGYSKSSPCVFLKMRKNRDWNPNYFNSTSELPSDMPAYLKDIIKNNIKKAVWLSCEGINPVDLENVGPMSFYPSAAYPFYYFPYKGQDSYLEPIIAVHFERPRIGIVISVKCTFWTKDYHESVEFELFVE